MKQTTLIYVFKKKPQNSPSKHQLSVPSEPLTYQNHQNLKTSQREITVSTVLKAS